MFELSGYTLTAMISEVGGFFSILFAVSSSSVYFFAKDEFWGSLIQALFRIKQSSSPE